jgi:hypothetical protein
MRAKALLMESRGPVGRAKKARTPRRGGGLFRDKQQIRSFERRGRRRKGFGRQSPEARFDSVELDTPVGKSMICERLRCKCYSDVESLKVGRTACSPGNFSIVEARPVGCEGLNV